MKKDHFLFKRKNEYFAVPIDEVSEIIETKITKKETIEEKTWIGLISNRNLLVPVFDSSKLHKWDREHIDEKEYTVIIINCEKTVYGLIMDKFQSVLSICFDHAVIRERETGDKYIKRILGFEESSLAILDTEKIARKVKKRIDDQKIIKRSDSENPDEKKLNEYQNKDGQFLLFSIQNIKLIIKLDQILEVIEGYKITPFFAVPKILRGLINLRGTVIACLDISEKLGLDLRILDMNTKFIIIRYQNNTIAICVDKIYGIKVLDIEKIQKVDLLLDEQKQKYINGIYEEQNDPLLTLSIEEILNTAEIKKLTNRM